MIKRVLCALAAVAALQSPLPAAVKCESSPFAVCGLGIMHGVGNKNPNFDGVRKKVAMMKEAGIYWDRGEIWWGCVEPRKDKWDWAYTDKMIDLYKEQKLNGMMILCYASAWSKEPPADDAERAAYANYVYQVVSRYKETIKVWEIWNEPNIPSFWKVPNVRDYTLMMIEAYKAAKKADPNCVVVGAAANGPGNDWIQGIYDNGGWDYCDVVSIHPYTLAGSPVTQRLERMLRILQKQIASHGKPKPLWISEMGWAAEKPEDDERQAMEIVQTYIMSLANGLEKYFYFNFDNYANYGLVRSVDPPQPKSSFGAYKLMTRVLGSPGPCAPFEGYLKAPEGAACYVFKKAGNGRVLFLWSNDEQVRTVQITQKSGLKAVDILNRPVAVENGKLSVGPTPVIVTGADSRKIGKVSAQFNPYIEKPGANLVLNSSFEQPDGKGMAACWNVGRFYFNDKNGKFALANDGRNGSRCMSISESGEDCAVDAYPLPVEMGRKYKLSGWMKSKDATGRNVISILWYDGDEWGYISGSSVKTITGTNGWTQVQVEGVAPKGASVARVNLISENNRGAVWFDDIKLTEE